VPRERGRERGRELERAAEREVERAGYRTGEKTKLHIDTASSSVFLPVGGFHVSSFRKKQT
jgi:hypothetical protein